MSNVKVLMVAAVAAASFVSVSAQAQTVVRTNTLRVPASTRTPAPTVPPPTVVVPCNRSGQNNASPC